MINPFTNDSKVQEMKKLGIFDYAVIYQDSNTNHNVIGFDDKDKAYKYAIEIFRGGLWAYVIDLSGDYILAYLSNADATK